MYGLLVFPNTQSQASSAWLPAGLCGPASTAATPHSTSSTWESIPALIPFVPFPALGHKAHCNAVRNHTVADEGPEGTPMGYTPEGLHHLINFPTDPAHIAIWGACPVAHAGIAHDHFAKAAPALAAQERHGYDSRGL